MALPTYAQARAVLVTALEAATTGWEIYPAPRHKMTARTIALTIRGTDRLTAGRWMRELIAAVFVPGKNPDEGLDALESVTPAIYTAAKALGGHLERTDPPIAVSVAGDDYIAQFHLITLETTE